MIFPSLTEIGSWPNEGLSEKLFNKGLDLVENSTFYQTKLDYTNPAVAYFSDCVKEGFKSKLDALKANDVKREPNYTQYQNMTTQFRRLYKKFCRLLFSGDSDHYITNIGELTLYRSKYMILPEVKILVDKASEICQEVGINKIKLRVCVSDPFTCNYTPKASKEEVDVNFVASLLASNIIKTDYLETVYAVIDVPNDISEYKYFEDYEFIFKAAKSMSPEVETGVHTHYSLYDFFKVKHLDTIQLKPHFIASKRINRHYLEENNKKVDVSLVQTRNVNHIEPIDIPVKRGETAISNFGLNNISHFTTECGMGGWSISKAEENLRLLARATSILYERYN